MSTTPPAPPPRRPLAAMIAAALALSAALYVGYNLWIGLDPDDSENLESTLVLAAAGQLTDGFGSLYGPYSGDNPRILIQAPLYYQGTALLAWPATALGSDPVAACLVAGRAISFLSFLACLVVVYHLATLDGAPRRAGLSAALLVASSAVVGSFPVTVRPDMAGVCLQTLGLTLVLGILHGRPASPSIFMAYGAFALAACMKQHFVVGPIFASCVLAMAAIRGRVRIGPVVAAHAMALGIVGLVYGIGEALTGGRMSRSIFELPRELPLVAAGSWAHVVEAFLTTLRRSVGLVALAAACAWACGRRRAGGRLDALLAGYIAAELALMVKLCLDSEGGWYNYALEATVCGSVLVGRALGRILPAEVGAARLAPVGLAALVLLLADARLVATLVTLRRVERAGVRQLLAHPSVACRPADALYFAGRPQHNRRYGCRALVHDEWLYEAFESFAAAEPRACWLRSALRTGPVRLVVLPSGGRREPNAVPGVEPPLPALGYRWVARSGRYSLWERR
jgi:hypothetical protein